MSATKSNAVEMLLYAAELVAQQARDSSEKNSFTAAQAQLAMHIDHGVIHAHELAQQLQISKQAVAQLIDAMVCEGVLARYPDPTDKRAKVILFTAKGQRLLQSHRRQLAGIESRLAELAGDKAINRLRKSLSRIVPHLTTDVNP